MNGLFGALEVLGGVRAASKQSALRSVLLGVWWFILFAIVLATVGRGTKFIYVDF